MDYLIELQKQFATAIFTSSLTIASFLFAMKSFVINSTKKEVYDSPEYKEEITRQIREGFDVKLYGPLNRFRTLLFYVIIGTIFVAMFQPLAVASKCPGMAAIALALTFLDWVAVIYTLSLVNGNTKSMIEKAEENFLKEVHAPNAKESTDDKA